MNKKGLWVANVYIDVFSIIAFVLIVVIFFVLFSYQGNARDEKIKGVSDEISGNIVLMNYLRTPVVADGEKISMSELIALSYHDENYSKLLQDKTLKFINSATYNHTENKKKLSRHYSVQIHYENLTRHIIVDDGNCLFDCRIVSKTFVPISLNKTVPVYIYQAEVNE